MAIEGRATRRLRRETGMTTLSFAEAMIYTGLDAGLLDFVCRFHLRIVPVHLTTPELDRALVFAGRYEVDYPCKTRPVRDSVIAWRAPPQRRGA